MIEADFHIHSRHSYDSFQSLERIVSYVQARGLDAFAITDHDAFVPYDEVAPLLNDSGPIYIPGTEIRTKDYDDLLGLFIDSAIESRRFDSAVAEIHDQGGLAVLPHPYRKFDSIPNRVLEVVDGLEALNARSKPKWNEMASTLGRERDLPMLGGSDAHTSFEIGRARTLLHHDGPVTAEAIKTAILNGTIGPAGTESPYYLTHGASVVMETVKSSTGLMSQNRK